MGPQTKKRKLQSATGPVPKRSKTLSTGSKKFKTPRPKPAKRKVDAESLAWKSVDEDEFGCLQVIQGVDIAKEGDKVRFLVSEEQQIERDDEDEGESFEGFGDDAVEGADLAAGEAGPDKAKPAGEDAHKQPDANGEEESKVDKRQAKKQQKQKRADNQLEKDAGLQEPPAVRGKKQSQANSFEALTDMADGGDDGDEGGDVDVAAWARLSISPRMLTAIAKLGFSKPTAIQEQAIPEILAGEDVVGKAQTGSGKTLAFGIPMVEKWLEVHDEEEEEKEKDKSEGSHEPMAVVLSPTRELAKQIGEHFKALCNGLPSSPYICVVTGGLSIQKQRRQLEKADIVVATPGRLWEVLEGDSKLQDSFTAIRFLVVDEADRLFKAGQFKEVEDILGALDKKNPQAAADSDSDDDEDEDLPPRQTLVFSATFDKNLQTKLAGKGKKRKATAGEEEDQMAYLMKSLRFRQHPKFIDVNPVRQMAVGLREGLIECGAMEKDLYLYTVLQLNPNRRTLVFTNSISAVRRITPFLQNLNIVAHPLHSQMPQKARLRSLERFSESSSSAALKTSSSVLVATDVAARGLDISEVDMVLHYHVPRAADTYVHRSGRTARGERSGVSVMLCSPEEVVPTRRLAGKVHAEMASDSSLTGKQRREHMIQTLPVDRKIASRLKPRADMAKTLADAALAKEKAHSDETFMRNAAEELGVEYDSEEVQEEAGRKGGRGGGRKKKEKEASQMSKAEMGAVRAQLKAELGRRVNLGVSERYITGGRVDVAALLREREQGMPAGIFLGGDGMGLGFDV